MPMTSHAFLARWLPVLYLLCLGLLTLACAFNGLYGQDAHEYLRQSQALLDHWRGAPAPSTTPGNAELAGLYPLAGAVAAWIMGAGGSALQWVSLLAAALAVWIMDQLLRHLAHGSRAESRWIFCGLGLALAPMFLRSAVTAMSDALGLCLLLACLLAGFISQEKKYSAWLLAATFFAALALSTRYALAALLIPYIIWLWTVAWRERRYDWIAGSVAAGILGLLPQIWLKSNVDVSPLEHSLLQDWSVKHFFQSEFTNASGTIRYFLPNLAYLFFPLAHPAFLLHLPLLLLLGKRTDLVLSEKKILLLSTLSYLLLLGGLPHQNLRYLLPVYVLWLLLFFPAWDRMYCYGLIFFRKTTLAVIGITLAVQLAGSAWLFSPVLKRNQLEQSVAEVLRARMPEGSVLYTFDLEPAMRTYLPGQEIRSLWERRYEKFETGAFVLFRTSALEQWAGLPPAQNWDLLQRQYQLEEKAVFTDGWVLWELK